MSRDARDGWEAFRPYLEMLARSRVPEERRGQVDLSGAVQETLIRVERRGDAVSFENEAQRRAYLRRTLFNLLGDRLAACPPTVPLPEGSGPALDETSPSQVLIREELLGRLAEALNALTSEEREAVQAHFLDGATQAEIAERLGRTRGAVAGLIRRAIDKLRMRLAEPSSRS